jgi:hypothetical protein
LQRVLGVLRGAEDAVAVRFQLAPKRRDQPFESALVTALRGLEIRHGCSRP